MCDYWPYGTKGYCACHGACSAWDSECGRAVTDQFMKPDKYRLWIKQHTCNPGEWGCAPCKATAPAPTPVLTPATTPTPTPAPTPASSDLCVAIRSFETDGDLDPANEDEPYARVCFDGQCIETDKKHRFGDFTNKGNCACTGSCGYGTSSYEWCYVKKSCPGRKSSWSGYWSKCNSNRVDWQSHLQCVPVQKALLATEELTLQVFEDDSFEDDKYTAPKAVRLPEACRDVGGTCALAEELKPLAGKFARLSLDITINAANP